MEIAQNSGKRWKRMLVFIGLPFLCLTQSHAKDTENPARLDLNFTVFPIDRTLIEGLYYLADADSTEISEVSFSARHRSRQHPYRGSETIFFYENSVADDGITPIRSIVASVVLPADIKEPLLFFIKGLKNGGNSGRKYHVIAIEDCTDDFPFGHFRVLNASGANLVGKVGTQRVSLGFKASKPLRISKLFRRDEKWVNVDFYVNIKDKNEVVYANQLRFEPKSRSVLVLRPPRRQNSARVMTYLLEDFEPPASKKTKSNSL
jgi:hypothetical protein